MEAGFRQQKEHDYIAVDPMFRWTDQKIAVHLFSCVFASSVLRLLTHEVHRAGLTMSTGEIMKELDGVQETRLFYPSTGDGHGFGACSPRWTRSEGDSSRYSN